MLLLTIGLLGVVTGTAMAFGTAVELYGWAFGQWYNPEHLRVCPLIAMGAFVCAAGAFSLGKSCV